ncbi:hypothetical protein XELAEV_18038321mg [Xenopus laevis]|uniref:Uncharacterized protein n=1 Tax=Xenopus laevis TaxID=8355 RepID=A0A974H6T2_XENLA|nr:hypothetical protein XELAEV_18038321mg [Xenopus laevis]
MVTSHTRVPPSFPFSISLQHSRSPPKSGSSPLTLHSPLLSWDPRLDSVPLNVALLRLTSSNLVGIWVFLQTAQGFSVSCSLRGSLLTLISSLLAGGTQNYATIAASYC